jgi:hypothetical protein
MGEHLLLRGEAHLVSRGQISGRCIHHAPLLGRPGIPLQSSKFLIAIAVIETPLGTLLVSAPRSPLLRSAHDRRAWLGAVPPTTAAATAKNQANAATRAASLDTELEHRKPTPKSWLPREHRRSCANQCCAFSRMLVQQPEGSERLTPGLRLMGGLAIVPGVASSGRISGRDRLPAGPLEVVPDQAGGSRNQVPFNHRGVRRSRVELCLGDMTARGVVERIGLLSQRGSTAPKWRSTRFAE